MGRMEREAFAKRLAWNRVIPAVRDDASLKRALQSFHDIIFVLYGDILNLESHVNAILKAGKLPFIHLDMIHGLANNSVVLEYFYRHFKRECGVITTKNAMAKKAQEMDILVVQRYFMLDSLALESVSESIGKAGEDAIEIMPGILPRIIEYLSHRTSVPVIAGGLIQTPRDVERILGSGAVAVSTTRTELWTLNRDSPALNPAQAPAPTPVPAAGPVR